MIEIYRAKFGSHLYGTSTPSSDIDYKVVFIPSAEDILLQKVKASHNPSPKGEAGQLDEERWSLQNFLRLVAEGQTSALEVLFTPVEMNEATDIEWWDRAVWNTIVKNTDKLLSKNAQAFVGYCRAQANRYSARGERVAAMRAAFDLVNGMNDKEILGDYKFSINKLIDKFPDEMQLFVTNFGNGGSIDMWSVCGRKVALNSKAKFAKDLFGKCLEEYGKRSLEAETSKGADWKALHHALRIGREAVEFLSTGHITLPRPDADYLLKVKLGQIPYIDVVNEIDRLLEESEALLESSTLPDKADQEWIDDFIMVVYSRVVAEWHHREMANYE